MKGFFEKKGEWCSGHSRERTAQAAESLWRRVIGAQWFCATGQCCREVQLPARVSCYTREEVKASSVKPSADRGSDGCSHAFRRDNSTLLPLDFPNPCSLLLTPNLSLTAITKIGTFLICSSRRQSRHTWVNNRPLLLNHYSGGQYGFKIKKGETRGGGRH